MAKSTKAVREMMGDVCGGCGCEHGTREPGAPVGVYHCAGCGGLVGTCYLGDSYGLVRVFMSDRTDMDGARYFDLRTLGSAGAKRRHGFYDPATRLILQVG